MKNYDLIIIGGGPIGIACGLAAKKKRLSYLILEKGTIVNSLFNYPKNMQFFSSSEKLEIDNVPFISKEAKPNRDEALEYYRRIVVSNDLNINLFENVERVEKINEVFNIITTKESYKSANLIIATGFYDIPNLIHVKGEELSKVSHYFKDPHYYATQKLAIVGASNSAVDAALECYRKGADVTLIVRGQEIGKRVKYWVRPDVINRIKEGSIKVYFNSTIKQITPTSVFINTPNGEKIIENDFVLSLAGYRPNFAFLESLGVTLTNDIHKRPTYNTKTMESNIKGLFLAGVICGGNETHKWFIENSLIHAEKITEAILNKN